MRKFYRLTSSGEAELADFGAVDVAFKTSKQDEKMEG